MLERKMTAQLRAWQRERPDTAFFLNGARQVGKSYLARQRGEVDFIADTEDGSALPIEVKSGRSYQTHAAIDSLLAQPSYGIERGLVLSRSNVAKQGSISYWPIYMAFFLAQGFQLYSQKLSLPSSGQDGSERGDPPFTLSVQPV